MTFPRATYRFQVSADFTLHDVAARVPYLDRLGVSHVYLSPITEARAGSTHGYDVIDTSCVSNTLGGEDALAALATALHARDMGVLLDIVPNHMAASTENPWWRHLLEHGPASEHARTFDTPWAHGESERLRLPVLGDSLENVLIRDELTIGTRDGAPIIEYFDRWFPVPAAAHERARAAAHDPERMRALLDSLPYELAHWKSVADQVAYRRFFDITDLIGLRVEDPAVFTRTHEAVLRWVANGWIDGLRIDHIDGLRDPERYLDELADATARARNGTRCYTVVEKILAADETIPPEWQTDGATGYEFARAVTAFLLDHQGYAQLDALRRRWTGESENLGTFTLEKKRYVLDQLFSAELTDVAQRVAQLGRLPVPAVRAVLRELTAALPVYRTYISERGVSSNDRQRIETAHGTARAHVAQHQQTVLDQVCAILLLDRAHASESARAETLEAVTRWQQLTGPVMAKGFEDTVLYSWPALLAVNEVGGEPGESMAAAALHQTLATRAKETPGALNATSTHDTKRSEDVRARLLVLSSHPAETAALAETWRTHLATGDIAIAPRDEIVLMQTLLGIWPLDGIVDETLAERVREFMRKAAREAKDETSWLEPDAGYENHLDAAVDYVLLDERASALRAEVARLVERIALHGACNSLNQVLLKCAAPGVPDVYQGAAGWRFDLVDPDNRRPVEFDALEATASELAALVDEPGPVRVRALMASWRDGRIKQYVLMAALACRRRNTAAFEGEYRPLQTGGEHARHVIAFERTAGPDRALTIATRGPGRVAQPNSPPIADVWGTAHVEAPQGVHAWRSVMTGERIEVVNGVIALRHALAVLPCDLLEPA